MSYKIIIKLEDKDLTPHVAISAGQYFSDALKRMQIASYSVDCYLDDATLMIKFPKNPEK
ncbi:MAG TPA: hypothetical protein VFZ05_04470 [Nitrososphaera sp.]